jgi:hypothetical protein
VIHASLLAAVHAQPAPVVTATVPAPPAAAGDTLCGSIAYAQGSTTNEPSPAKGEPANAVSTACTLQ